HALAERAARCERGAVAALARTLARGDKLLEPALAEHIAHRGDQVHGELLVAIRELRPRIRRELPQPRRAPDFFRAAERSNETALLEPEQLRSRTHRADAELLRERLRALCAAVFQQVQYAIDRIGGRRVVAVRACRAARAHAAASTRMGAE